MDSVEEEIDECRGLRERGFYAEASKRLQTYLDKSTDLRVAADLGEVLMFQGYYRDALQVLKVGLASSTGHEYNLLLHYQVEMKICFMTPVVTGSFDESLRRATYIYEKYLDRKDSKDLERDAVCIESFHSKVLQLAAKFRKTQNSVAIEHALTRLETMFYGLLKGERFSEAFTIASDFGRCFTIQADNSGCAVNTKELGKLMKELVEWPSATPLIKAKGLNELAEFAENSGDVTTSCALEELAKDLFEQSKHRHGSLDISFRQICRTFKEGAADLDKGMELVKEYIENYKDQDFLHGLHSALGAFLNSISHLYNFELQLGLVHMCQSTAEKCGSMLFWILRYAGLLAQWLTHSARAPRVIEGAKAMYEEIQGSDCYWIRGFIANITAQAYWQMSDSRNALHWAELCKSAWQFCSPMDKAEATTMILRAKLNRMLDEDVISQIIEVADVDIEEEIKAGLISPAVDQLDLIVSQVLIPNHDSRATRWLQRIEPLIAQLFGLEADIKLANLHQAFATSILAKARESAEADAEEEALNFLEKAVALYLKHKRLIEAANTRQIHGMVLHSIFKKSPTLHNLQRTIEIFSIANDAFRAVDNSSMISTSSHWYSFFTFEGWRRGWVDANSVLEALLAAEAARDQERLEMSIFEGLEALVRKQEMSASNQIRALYDMAFMVCIQEDIPEILWDWIQKAKARSVSDTLGLGIVLAEALESKINEDPEMKDLFQKERALLIAIREKEIKERLALRGELHILQKQMRNHPSLKAAIDFREGCPIKLEELHNIKLPKGMPGQLLFADWIFTNENVYLCTVKGQQMPIIKKCDVTKSLVEAWKRTFLDSEEGRQKSLDSDDFEEGDPEHPLRQLDQLVAPLADLIDEDDMIICSVTGILHSIPIHALWVNHKPLVVETPLIYCASMTTFVQCWHRAAVPKMESRQRTFMAVYEPSLGTKFNPKEQKEIFAHIKNLAEDTKDVTIIGKEASSGRLELALQDSTIFHFHGHCTLGKASINDQCLILADRGFSVSEFFNIKLRAQLITLIACDSASQSVSAGDEPLGIVTALLCAGASSVLGTIWPTASGSGRKFSKHFYKDMEAKSTTTVFDLARALQKAVIKIRDNRRTRQPYYWAPFVLHGAPFMRLDS